MVRLRVATVIVAVLTANTAVQAQDDVGDRTEGLAGNSNQDCSRSPGQSQSPGRSADLSDQLAQSNGVICPPGSERWMPLTMPTSSTSWVARPSHRVRPAAIRIPSRNEKCAGGFNAGTVPFPRLTRAAGSGGYL